MRLIAVGGGKGGIFKTATAQALAAFCERNSVKWCGADTDQENKSFADVYSDVVKPFDVYDVNAGRLRTEQVNALVNDIDAARRNNTDVYILDQGAGQANVLRGAMVETGMLDEIASGALQMTIVFVTVNTDAALSTLASNLESTFPDVPAIQWIVAANEYKDTLNSTIADAMKDSSLQDLLKKRKAKTLRIPLITDTSVVTAWENSHLPLAQFEIKGAFAERGRIKAWTAILFAEFERVRDDILPQPKKKTQTVAAAS